MTGDVRIDAYIDAAPPFARPVLRHLRATVHAAVPRLDETIKWGRPFFMLDGRPFAMMAAFKAHAIFGFWRGGDRGASGREGEAGGQFGRITSLADLPEEGALRELVRRAAAERGDPAPIPRKAARPPLETPPELAAALAGEARAAACYETLPPGRRREYLEWIIEAKRPETRARRIATTIAQLAEGKPLHWKYRSG